MGRVEATRAATAIDIPVARSTPEIIQEPRVWPYFANTGIPLLPRKTRCVGEECYATATYGICNPKSDHHMLFDEGRFRKFGYPYDQLVVHPFMIREMAECRHNAYETLNSSNAIHARYDRSAIPERNTAFRFMDEARLLQAIARAVTDVRESFYHYINIHNLRPAMRYDLSLPRHMNARPQRLIDSEERFKHCMKQVETFEVIPQQMIDMHLTETLQRRARVRTVFEQSADTLPAPLVEAAIDCDFLRPCAA